MQLNLTGPLWVGRVVLGIMVLLSVILLSGKGSFLIAGYNTSSKEDKEKYDEKRLCHVMGGGLGLLSLQLAVPLCLNGYLPKTLLWMYPYGIFGVIAVMIFLANTVCKKKR